MTVVNIREKRITVNSTAIQRIIRKYYEYFYASTLDNSLKNRQISLKTQVIKTNPITNRDLE